MSSTSKMFINTLRIKGIMGKEGREGRRRKKGGRIRERRKAENKGGRELNHQVWLELPSQGYVSLIYPEEAQGHMVPWFITTQNSTRLFKGEIPTATSTHFAFVQLLLLLLLSRFSRVRPCATPETAAHQAPPSLGFSRQELWSGSPFPSPMHESEKWKGSRSVVSDSSRPHGLQPTRLLHPWDFPGESPGVGAIAFSEFSC